MPPITLKLVEDLLKEIYEARYGTKNRSQLILKVTALRDLIAAPLWKLEEQWDRDIHSKPFYEAICPHGIGHHKGVHGCDGCCDHWPKDITKKVSKD